MSATEKGVLQPKTFCFQWTIEHFFAGCEKLGDFYTSPVFPISYPDKLTKWYLKVYPKGEDDNCEDKVSIFLMYESENISEVTVDYRLSVMSKKNSLPKLVEQSEIFKGSTDNWGWKEFIKQDIIKDKKHGALINDTLTIVCEITFPTLAQDDAENLKGYNHLLNKIDKAWQDYEELLENKHFSDVTFIVKDKKLYLHKAILSCRNAVFKAMFESKPSEGKKQKLTTEVVKITDFDYDVMKEMFRFIYSGKVENIGKIAKDLLIAADKYCIVDLKSLCEITLTKTLQANLTNDNVVEYLNLTDMCDNSYLKTPVIKYVVANLKEVINKPGFSDLKNHVLFQIMQAIADEI